MAQTMIRNAQPTPQNRTGSAGTAPGRTRRRLTLYWLWIGLLATAFAIGVYSALQVLTQGLGITNLSDELPWGLWITVDLSSIALGAGAFTFSAAVYLFGFRKYEAIARAAVLVGFLGYTSAMIALFVDIGRFDRFYHPIIYWNVHSVLWEITMCVIFYTTVLAVEVLPVIIESTPLKNIRALHGLAHFLHRLTPFLALAGMGLSLLHQSSLGATYGILTARPVWYSPSAPVLFILSAVAAGTALTLLVTLVAGKLTAMQLAPADVINGMAKVVGFACLAYLYLKIWSWAATNYYSNIPEQRLGVEVLATNTPYNFTFWFGEVLFGALVPAIIMLWRRLRSNTNVLILGGLMIVAGLVINRWNMTLSGFVIPLDWSPGVRDVFGVNSYTPALVEWGVALGIVAYSWLGFSLGARFLKLYPRAKSLNPPPPSAPTETPSPVEDDDTAPKTEA
ncbi:MAG: polysulfide reductase NrfD [Anaerolineae bacterium]|nr:polysulfide reductase NrfD [Anaerolineae bacterium]NUQ04920.1 polysulfide reductase NrfD [Anaerolineae bacterium]